MFCLDCSTKTWIKNKAFVSTRREGNLRWLCKKTLECQVWAQRGTIASVSLHVRVSHCSNAVDQTFGCFRSKNFRGKASNIAIPIEVFPLSLSLCYELVFLQSSKENQDAHSVSMTELGYIKLHLPWKLSIGGIGSVLGWQSTYLCRGDESMGT